MKKIYPDLWQTEKEMRFGTLATHAYLLQREGGNVLFYTTNNRSELDLITEIGGITFHCVSHCHEVDTSQAMIKEAFNTKLCSHALVEPYFKGSVSVEIKFNSLKSEVLSGDIDVIHTPGHTNNSVCYLYHSPHGKNYIFVGDVIYMDKGAWKTLIVSGDGGDKYEMIESLKLLRTIDVDVVICSVAIGTMEIVEVNKAKWGAIIDGALAELTT